MTSDIERNLSVHEQVLVEFDSDGRPVSLRAVVVNLMPAALWLGLARPDSLLEQVRPDQPLHITFKRDGVALVASSRFVNHLGSSRSRLFAVKWPDELQTVQRREHLRIDAACPVQYVAVRRSDAGGAGRTGRGTTRNISAGGILFEVQFDADNEVIPGDELDVTMGLGYDAVTADAEVVHAEPVPDPGPGQRKAKAAAATTLVAVRFLSISEAGRDKIIRHIFSVQRQRR